MVANLLQYHQLESSQGLFDRREPIPEPMDNFLKESQDHTFADGLTTYVQPL